MNDLITPEVRYLTSEITETERSLPALEAERSALEEKIGLNRINIEVCKAKIAALQGLLKDVKGESK